MLLQAVRPEQEGMQVSLPRADNPEVLRIVVNCLKVGEELYTDPQFQKWVWMVWLQWRALIVALAGLCSIRDTSLATEAWIWVEAAYARYPRLIADATSGMLWRPMVRLYQKANMFKEYRDTSKGLAGVPSSELSALRDTPFSLTEIDTWEADALNAIENMPRIEFADLELGNQALQIHKPDLENLARDMSIFMQEQDWTWLQDGFP